MKTAYKNISDTNSAFGNLKGACVDAQGNIINNSRLLSQVKNLYEELDELRDEGFNILSEDKKEGRIGQIDAIGDLIVFTYGAIHFLGVNYSEEDCNQDTLDHLSIYNLENDETYTVVYNDIKQLIDNFVFSVENNPTLSNIMQAAKKLDSYLVTLCKFYDIDIEKAIQNITDSNMSKLCKDNFECEATLKHYRDLGVDVYSKESPLIQNNGKPFLVVYSSCEQEVKGKLYRAHKFLKNVNWSEPDLSSL